MAAGKDREVTPEEVAQIIEVLANMKAMLSLIAMVLIGTMIRNEMRK